jgi:hypothetical protein
MFSPTILVLVSPEKLLLSVSSTYCGGTERPHVAPPYFSGVGIGVVHAGYERRLAHHLGAHSTPSILGIINGKISFFHNAVVRENLRQFVESLLPGNLVEKVRIWWGEWTDFPGLYL